MLTKVRSAITPWPGTARCAAAHATVPSTACALLSGLSTLMHSDAPDAARLAPHKPRSAAPCRTRMLTHQPARPAASPALRAPALPRAAPPPRRATRGKDPEAEANFLCSDDVRNSRTACIPAYICMNMHGACPARRPATSGMRTALKNGCLMGSSFDFLIFDFLIFDFSTRTYTRTSNPPPPARSPLPPLPAPANDADGTRAGGIPRQRTASTPMPTAATGATLRSLTPSWAACAVWSAARRMPSWACR